MNPDTEGYLPITPPFGLANNDPVPWVVVSVMGSTIQWHLWAAMSFPQPNIHGPVDIHTHYTLPRVFTHHQWDAAVDIHGRSHNQVLGDHLSTVLLWHHHIFTSLGSGLTWGGAGTSVPCMMDSYTQGNTNLWCNEKKLVSVEDAWPSALVCHLVGGDICCNLMHHLTCFLFPPIPNLPLSLKGISLQ